MSQDCPTVLHVLAPAPFGGLESVVQALSIGLRRAGSSVHVLAVVHPSANTRAFFAPLETAGVRVHVLGATKRGYRKERTEMQRRISSVRPDVVHTHGFRPDVVDAPVARAERLPTITTVHGFVRTTPRIRFYEWLQRRAFRKFDAVLAVSRPLFDELADSGVGLDRLHLVPNAWSPTQTPPLDQVEAREELDLDPGTPIVGWVGRLSKEKAPDLMIDAMAMPELKHVTVCFVGDGPLMEAAQSRARTQGVERRVRFAGPIREAFRLMPAFDALAISSHTEGTPVVLFEATAAGVPVIATAVGGIPAVLGDGFNLVAPGDPRALAGALGRVLTSRSAGQWAVDRARRSVEGRFSEKTWITKHLELYRSLLQRRAEGEGVGPARQQA